MAGRVLRRILILIVAASAIIASVALIAREWAIPAYIRYKLASELGNYWRGEVKVGDVQIYFAGLASINDVVLSDNQGNDWARIDSIRISLKNWPSSKPSLDVNFNHVVMHAHMDNEMPLVIPPAQEPSDPLTLDDLDFFESIKIHRLSLGATKEQNRLDLDDLAILASRAENGISLQARPVSSGADQLTMLGIIDAEGECKIEAQARYALSPDEAQFFSSVLKDIAGITITSGELTAWLSGRGELDRLSELDLVGLGELRDGAIGIQDAVEVSNIVGRVSLAQREIEITDVSADVMGGRLEARGEVKPLEDQTVFAGTGNVRDVDLHLLADAIGVELADGRVGAEVEFAYEGLWRLGGEIAFDIQNEQPGRLSGKVDVVFDDDALVRLADWRWAHPGRELVSVREAVIGFSPACLTLENVTLVTPGGLLKGRAEVLTTEDEPVYSGRFSSEDFDVLAFLPELPDDAPDTLRISLVGEVSGVGASRIVARTTGPARVNWIDEQISATGDLTMSIEAHDLAEGFSFEKASITCQLDDGWMWVNRQLVIKDCAIFADVGERGASGRIRAGVSGGTVDGQLTGELQDEGLRYSGDLRVGGIDSTEFPHVIASMPEWLHQGMIDGRVQFEGVDLKYLATSGEGSALVQFDTQGVGKAGARYMFDVRIDGLDGAEKPWEVHGTARIEDGFVADNNDVHLASNVRISAISFGRSADVSSIRAKLLGGSAHGMLRLDFMPDEDFLLRGGVTIDNLELPRLAATMGDEESELRGLMDVNYRFLALNSDVNSLRGNGMVLIRNSRMMGVPVFDQILAALGAQPDAGTKTDLDLLFSNQGEIVTVRGSRLATPIIALNIVPGATANLNTHEIDAYVVAAALSDVEAMINTPFLSLLVPFARSASQLHVSGRWDSKDTIRISKEPIRDVGGATVRFFKDAVKTGGELGDTFIQPAREMAP